MKTLLIDDVREFDVTFTAKDYAQGIVALQSQKWDILYLDHDLGDANAKTGYDIMCWLEQNLDRLPRKIMCVSGNPVGRERINLVIKKLYGWVSVVAYPETLELPTEEDQ